MLSAAPLEPGAAALAEAKAYLRVEGAGEDALIGRLLASAAELCEKFTRQALIRRSFVQSLPATRVWRRLGTAPVVAIGVVETAPVLGEPELLPPVDYGIDIDASGQGWLRLTAERGPMRVRVHFEAGLGEDWSGLPEGLRYGILRLAAHFYASREAGDGPPASVAALWRPWRRLRLG